MTLPNKDWYNSNSMRLYLSGYSQEAISNELRISEGKINEIIHEFIASDDLLAIQREIAVVSKKTGTPIKQLAVNLAFANAIKRLAFDEDKIDSFLQAINQKFNQDKNFSEDEAAKSILEICNFLVKNGIELKDLPSRIEREKTALDDIHFEILTSKKLLAETQRKIHSATRRHDITLKNLREFVNARDAFEEIGMDFKDKEKVLNVLCSIKEIESDPKKIVKKLMKIRFLEVTLVNLKNDFAQLKSIVERLQGTIEEKKMYLGALTISIDLCNKLIMKGFDQNGINNIFQIISGFSPGLQYVLTSDLQTYGDLQVAIYKRRQELNELDSGLSDPLIQPK